LNQSPSQLNKVTYQYRNQLIIGNMY
jgi:hypothetical protein